MLRSEAVQASPRRTTGRTLPTGRAGRAARTDRAAPVAPRADCRDGAAGRTDDTRGEWHDWHRNRPIAFTQLNINKDKIESLAQALAAGDSAATWAEAHAVPRRTAYRWAAEAGLKARVRGLRQGLVTDAVGRLAAAATSAVIDVQSHTELAERLARLEELADAQRPDEA